MARAHAACPCGLAVTGFDDPFFPGYAGLVVEGKESKMQPMTYASTAAQGRHRPQPCHSQSKSHTYTSNVNRAESTTVPLG